MSNIIPAGDNLIAKKVISITLIAFWFWGIFTNPQQIAIISISAISIAYAIWMSDMFAISIGIVIVVILGFVIANFSNPHIISHYAKQLGSFFSIQHQTVLYVQETPTPKFSIQETPTPKEIVQNNTPPNNIKISRPDMTKCTNTVTTVQYFPKKNEARNIQEALKKTGLTIKTGMAANQLPTNVMWVGECVSIEDIQKVSIRHLSKLILVTVELGGIA